MYVCSLSTIIVIRIDMITNMYIERYPHFQIINFDRIFFTVAFPADWTAMITWMHIDLMKLLLSYITITTGMQASSASLAL